MSIACIIFEASAATWIHWINLGANITVILIPNWSTKSWVYTKRLSFNTSFPEFYTEIIS